MPRACTTGARITRPIYPIRGDRHEQTPCDVGALSGPVIVEHTCEAPRRRGDAKHRKDREKSAAQSEAAISQPSARAVPLATVQHARVTDDVTRRIVRVRADQSQALKTPFDMHVAVLERAEHRLVQW